MLELILGVEVCKALRLIDIKIINYAIPVVFKCVDQVDEAEYERHFVPFCKVVSFWVTFFSCVGFTYGTGFLYCSPIAIGVEWIVGNHVAPRLNEGVWKRVCN